MYVFSGKSTEIILQSYSLCRCTMHIHLLKRKLNISQVRMLEYLIIAITVHHVINLSTLFGCLFKLVKFVRIVFQTKLFKYPAIY